MPYSTVVNVKVPDGKNAMAFNYSYALFTESKDAEWERDPARRLEILSSQEYRGQLGNTHSF